MSPTLISDRHQSGCEPGLADERLNDFGVESPARSSACSRLPPCRPTHLCGTLATHFHHHAVRESDAGWHFLLAEPVATVAPLPLQLPAKRASAGKSKSVEPKPEPLARALLDHVYRVTAELCGLDEFGRDEIITKRQFPNGVDTGVPYFSLPRSGGHVEQVSRQLVAQFGTDVLARVPGFRVHCALPRHRDLQH